MKRVWFVKDFTQPIAIVFTFHNKGCVQTVRNKLERANIKFSRIMGTQPEDSNFGELLEEFQNCILIT